MKEVIDANMKEVIDTSLYEKGRLKCLHCVHNLDCDELFDQCVANFLLNGVVVHLKSKEDVLL